MRIILTTVLMFAAMGSLAHDAPPTQEPMTLDELAAAFGWSLDDPEVTAEQVADDLHVIFGVGGNIAVSIGEDGVLIVDDQFPQIMPQIKDTIEDLGGRQVDFVVNTHWHFDHAEGNLALGPEGAWLVSHINSRKMMQEDHIVDLVSVAYNQSAYPPSAWPDVTYDTTMQFHLNGQRIDLMHFGPAHTTGDTAVIFRGSNAVHLGDVYNNSGFPFIDFGNGGGIDGVIEFCSRTLEQIDEDTVVIPGHGPVATRQDLADYISMLKTIRGRIVDLIRQGASLAEVNEANVAKEWEEWGGDPALLINRAYLSLTHKHLE
ncbi:MAG: MBL fold metallo-hydrolase [Pseudomonadales bacterium]|nr:MBL fold metallo-hydrolase [Pseudomonadales bacterium]